MFECIKLTSSSDTARFFAVRVGGAKHEGMDDNEKSFADLQERLAKTIKYLQALDPKIFEGKEDAEVIVQRKAGELKFTGLSYATDLAVPNFYFHFVTAYALLRKEGVPIGKADYLRSP